VLWIYTEYALNMLLLLTYFAIIDREAKKIQPLAVDK
jgi:hypothetical protein